MKQRASMGLAMVAALSMGPSTPAAYQSRLNSFPPAKYTPDQDRKPRGVNRAAKRAARKKAVAWKGKR